MKSWARVGLVAALLLGLGAVRASAQDVFLTPTVVHDFGALFVGEESPPLTLTVENRGTAEHVVADIRLNDATAFLLDAAAGATACGDVPVTLVAGASCTVEVVFVPVDTGTFSGTVFVHSDDPDAPILAASVVGEGRLHPDPTLAAEPLTVDFSAVTVGDTKGPLVVRIENRGAPDLDLDAMSLDNQRLFRLDVTTAGDRPCGTTTPSLAALESCTVGVSFSPDQEGLETTALRLRSNDPATPEVEVTLTGLGTPDTSTGDGGGCFIGALRPARAARDR